MKNISEEIKQNKAENAGFTLIEVILSMVILALLSIPLLGYFTNSTKYNALMSTQQHATSLAQQIAEDLKDQDVILTGTSGDDYVSEYLEAAQYGDPDRSVTTVGGSDYWTLTYTGYSADIDENYDVQVVFTDTVDNQTAVSVVPSINSDSDVIAQETNQYSEAVLYFETLNTMASSTPATSEEVKACLDRTITILIEESSGKYHVNISEAYVCNGLEGVDDGATYTPSDILDTYVSTLGKIYLLFDANVYASSGDTKVDTIEIYNETRTLDSIVNGEGATPDLILVCQNVQEYNDQTTLGVAYKVELDAYMANSNKADYITDVLGTIRTNMGLLYSDFSSNCTITNLDVASLTDESMVDRRVDVTVSVYKKGTIGTSEEEKYISVDASCFM